MADPLGLVFSGQDATGAAFKAPWTSYDPYQAEVMAGQNKIAMMQKKRELDEKKKEDALKIASLKAPNWTKYIGTASDLQSTQSDWITKAFAEGRQGEVEQAAALLKTFNQGFTNAVNSNYSEYLRAENAVNRDPDAFRDVALDNFAVFENPEIATDNYYPGVAEAYNKNLEVARQRMSTLPKDSYSEDAVKSYAALLTQNEKRSELLQVPKQYSITEWMPKLVSQANTLFQQSAQADVSGNMQITKKEVTVDEAKNLIDDLYQGDIRFQNQMMREFNKMLTPEQREQYKNPREYAKERYNDQLVAASKIERKTGGGIGISIGGGATSTIDPTTGLVRTTPVGGTKAKPEATSSLTPGDVSTPIALQGAGDVYTRSATKRYVKLKDNTAPGQKAGLGPAGVLPLISTSLPFSAEFKEVTDYPTAMKTVKLPNGDVIKQGDVLTDETFAIIKNAGYKLDAGSVRMVPYVDVVLTSGNVSESALVPYNDVKGGLENQYKNAGKLWQGHPAVQDNSDTYISNKFGIQFAAPSTGGSTGTQAKPAAQAQRKTIKESEIAAKAKASGYTEAEYRKLLQQNGIQIEK